MVDVVTIAVQAVFGIALLSIAALGLAIIFGMMKVINLAHGAFILIGAYVAFLVTSSGYSLWLAFLVAPVVVGAVGLVVERTVIHRLYERPLDTLLATWGISLVIQELIRAIFGTSAQSVSNPLREPIVLFGASFSTYRVFLTFLAAALIGATYVLFKHTDFGIKSRAVIQNDEMANTLGTNVRRIYMYTFTYGAALAGIAGTAIAPILSVDPNTGLGYLVQSFFVVILGGTGSILAGTLGGSAVIGGAATTLSFVSSQTFAQTVVFAFVIVLIRLKPQGLFGGT
jgi:branched-chain amino acid transport system permease protein/urea transport system permease protein